MDHGNQWTGGYGPYPGDLGAPGYSAGPARLTSLNSQWPMGMQPVQQTQQQAHNMRGAQKGVFWGPTRIKTDYQLPTSILGYPRHHTGAGELAGAKNCIKKV